VGGKSSGEWGLIGLDGKYNFLDKNGRFLSDSGFEKAFDFSQGTGWVRVDGKKWGVMNAYGDWVVKPVFELLPPDIDEEDPEYDDVINHMHHADLRSEIKSVSPSDLAEGPLFEECGAFGMSVVPVKVGERYGFIDCENKWAVKPVLDDYRKNLWVDHVPVKINGKWGCAYFPRPAFVEDLDSYQDEMQVVEHPILGSLREAILSRGLAALTMEDGSPTPVLVVGAERRCRVKTDANPDEGRPYGLYGNQFGRADEETVRKATVPIEPPTVTNLIAMVAPSGGYGPYTKYRQSYSGIVSERNLYE